MKSKTELCKNCKHELYIVQAGKVLHKTSIKDIVYGQKKCSCGCEKAELKTV